MSNITAEKESSVVFLTHQDMQDVRKIRINPGLREHFEI